MGAGGGETHFVWSGADDCGNRLAGSIKQTTRLARYVVAPTRIGIALIKRSEKGLARSGAHRQGAGSVKIASRSQLAGGTNGPVGR